MDIKNTSKIGQVNGRNVFMVNGLPISYAAYCDPQIYTLYGDSEEAWAKRIKDFVDSDVHMFVVEISTDSDCLRFEGEPLSHDRDKILQPDRQIEIILGLDPDARFIIRYRDLITKEWAEENLGHMQTTSKKGADYRTGYVLMPCYEEPVYSFQVSLASAKGLEEQCSRSEKVLMYCESRPWANRVIGYLYLPNGEGTNLLNIAGEFFDCCDEMQAAFSNWVRRNYKDEETLRKAWGDNNITFESVRVPSDDEWKNERQKVFHWVEGTELRRMRDYLLLQRELFIHWYKTAIRRSKAVLMNRPVIFGVDMVKQTLLGWQHNLSFYGHGPGSEYPNIIAATGTIDVGEIMDEPGLDTLITPGDYTARTVGYCWESEGSADSMRIRGKTIYVENDSRTFNPGQEDNTLGTFKTPEELKAGLLRNAAWSLSRGQMDYWAIAGGKYFHNREVQEKGIRVVKTLSDRAPYTPYSETEHAIAMIIDDTSPLYENGTSGYQNLAVIWQRVIGLAHCGIPYRVYLFSDLVKDNMPDYRCYIFPNLFKMDEERMQILQNKIFRDGRMAIFGPSTGITDGEKLSAEWASRVLGVQMKLIRREAPRRVIVNSSHPITKNLPSSLIYGDSQLYGPILLPENGSVEKAGGVVLGESTVYWCANNPGLFVKDFDGKYKVAWSVAIPLPANLLRELARYGGCNVWCEEDDVVLACGNIASLHSSKSGEKKLKLPSTSDIWDIMTGEKVGNSTKEITINITAPETRIFYLGKDNAFNVQIT